MPDYVYTAKNEAGTELTGQIAANSKREALDAIHRLKLFPVRIEDSKKGEITIPLFKRRITDSQVADILIQLADLMENGVPVLHAFQVLEKQTPNLRLKSVIGNIRNRIAEGESIHNAFAVHSNVFNHLVINVIRAGAEGAFLEDALRRVGDFIEKQAETKEKVIGTLIYPLILLATGFFVVIAILLVIVPMFQEIFSGLSTEGQELPLATRSLYWMRAILIQYGYYMLGVAFLLFFWIRTQLSTQWGIRFWDRIKMRIPLMGKILLDGAVARFCRVLGTLLENGVPILKSLEISGQSTGNSILADAVQRSVESVSSGESLSRPLAESGMIPTQVMAMINVAEESNTLEHVLVHVAETIERRTSRKLDTLIRILEPFLLMSLGLTIFYILLALLLPMVQLWESL